MRTYSFVTASEMEIAQLQIRCLHPDQGDLTGVVERRWQNDECVVAVVRVGGDVDPAGTECRIEMIGADIDHASLSMAECRAGVMIEIFDCHLARSWPEHVSVETALPGTNRALDTVAIDGVVSRACVDRVVAPVVAAAGVDAAITDNGVVSRTGLRRTPRSWSRTRRKLCCYPSRPRWCCNLLVQQRRSHFASSRRR